MSVLKYLGEDKKYHALPIGEIQSGIFPSLYDYTEHCIGRWTNNKPLYRKVIPCNVQLGSNGQWYQTNIDVSDLNIDSIVNGYFKQDGTPAIPFLMNVTVGGTIQYWGTSAQLAHVYNYLIMDYTKTTDAENSFEVSMVNTLDLDTEATDAEVDYCFN